MVFLDFETRSEAELRGPLSVGLHNYACHKSTQALMLAWAFDEESVELWQMHLGSMPDKLRKGLEDKNQELSAWNSAFERYVFKYVLNVDIEIERFVDPQASARYLSLPGSLEDVSEILKLPKELTKDKDGKRLIDIFSKPTVPRKKKGQERQEPYFRDWNTDPEEWEKFCQYCIRDVSAEREIQRRLMMVGTYPLPPKERKLWVVDQRINDRGIPVDVDFVRKASRLATRAKKESIKKQNELTGLENANSNKQMLEWVRERGFEGNSLRKDAVEFAIKHTTSFLTEEAREALKARKEASSTSYKKLDAILRHVSADGRLRNQFIFMGSSRCGRWSGNAVQLQNMARPEKQFEELDALEEARTLIHSEDYETIVKKFGSVLLTIKSCLRTVFVAPAGKVMVVSDLNAIETRVVAWLSGCEGLLDVFRNNKDPYIDFAVKMTQIPYEKLESDMKSKNSEIKNAAKRHRQMAKPGVLGCCYGLGGGQMGTNKYGDPVKQGLWGYAAAMGVDMSMDQAHHVVKIFRESYPEIPKFWITCEKAVADVLKEGTTRVKREIGPNGCVKIDKLNRKNSFPILRIQLPSGRFLHYMDARIESVKVPWMDQEGNEVFKNNLVYSGVNQETKQWGEVVSRGSKLFENEVQGIAREVEAEGIVGAEEIGLEVDAHSHDEIIAERVNDLFASGISDLESLMSRDIDYLPGLPLKADGFESPFYRKG